MTRYSADPKFIEGHILTASILAAQGKPDTDVVNAVNKAISLDPKRIESYISLERLYMTREKAPRPRPRSRKGIAASPSSVLGYTEYGRFLMYANRDAEAEAQFQKAIAIDNGSIEAREAIAEFYVTSRQMAKAEAAYLDLVQIQENSPESRLELAEFYATSDRKDEAVAVLNQILADTPEYVPARYRLGQIYLDRKDIAKVNEQLDALFKINDNDTEALMLRARVKMQENKAEDAVKDLEEILKKQPSGRDALFLMAQARLSLGQIDQGQAFIADLDRYHPTFLKTGLLKIQAAFAVGEPQIALKLSNELIDKANAALPNADQPHRESRILRGGRCLHAGWHISISANWPKQRPICRRSCVCPRSLRRRWSIWQRSLLPNVTAELLSTCTRNRLSPTSKISTPSAALSTSIQLNQTAKASCQVDGLIAANEGKDDVLAALHYLKSTIFSAEKNTGRGRTGMLAIDRNR